MSDVTSDSEGIPSGALARAAKLAALPLGMAGRLTVGLGKRLGGVSSSIVNADIQRRTAEQLFSVLGQLKGGAMKFGQALSVFEAALPDQLAGPYREALTKLQDSAPPLPVASVHKVLREQLGANWRDQFHTFDDKPAAAASIGQVHKAVWADGREVAVKIQYPGAGPALLSDFTQLSRIAKLFSIVQPGLDIKPLLAELRSRLSEELDYQREGRSTRAFAAAYADDPEIAIPDVVAATDQVLITQWLEGVPLSAIIADGDATQRAHAGRLLATFHFSAPAKTKLLHADPHPGNFRILPDGRLGVLDFGAVAELPDGLPEPIGRLTRMALDGQAEKVLAGLRAEGFIKPDIEVDAQGVLEYLLPMLAPLQVKEFQFSRAWLRGEAARIADPRNPGYSVGRQLNLPPAYLLIHRVTMGSIGVLCQLEAKAPYREIVATWQPGFAS